MSFLHYKIILNKKKLFFQLLIIFIIVIFFSIKNTKSGFAAINGVISALIPNMFFYFFINFFNKKKLKIFLPWELVLAEFIKIIITIILLSISLNICKTDFFSLGITWILTIIIQILLPTAIIKINDKRKKNICT